MAMFSSPNKKSIQEQGQEGKMTLQKLSALFLSAFSMLLPVFMNMHSLTLHFDVNCMSEELILNPLNIKIPYIIGAS